MSPSAIEWTEETWNPTVGCSRVSPGCTACYAIGVAHRGMTEAHRGLTVATDRGPDWTGEVRCLPERLEIPLKRRKPTTWFVDSMSDLFHPDVPDEFIAEVFAVMGAAAQHTFQVLTKRPQRMARLLADESFGEMVEDRMGAHTHATAYPPFPNVWLGTSVENQRYADLRIPHLLATPAAVRFLSCEPLLGPIDLRPWLRRISDEGADAGEFEWDRSHRIDWVIAGGESGPKARPMHVYWARSLRDECQRWGVPFFMKQWGEWAWAYGGDPPGAVSRVVDDGSGRFQKMWRVGKKRAGRVLDGRTWDEMPERAL